MAFASKTVFRHFLNQTSLRQKKHRLPHFAATITGINYLLPLSCFLVNGSLSLKRTVLFKFQTLRMFSLVLHERVIISFARRAF